MAFNSPKQKAFVQEYLVDLNATQAAIRAGYSPRAAKEQGYRNLTKAHIQIAIQKAMEARATKTGITAERTIKEIAKVAYMDPRKFFDEKGNLKSIVDLDDDTAAAVAGMDISVKYSKDADGELKPETIKKIKIADKLKALQDLGKHQGIFEKDNLQKWGEVLKQLLEALPTNVRDAVTEKLLEKVSD